MIQHDDSITGHFGNSKSILGSNMDQSVKTKSARIDAEDINSRMLSGSLSNKESMQTG